MTNYADHLDKTMQGIVEREATGLADLRTLVWSALEDASADTVSDVERLSDGEFSILMANGGRCWVTVNIA